MLFITLCVLRISISIVHGEKNGGKTSKAGNSNASRAGGAGIVSEPFGRNDPCGSPMFAYLVASPINDTVQYTQMRNYSVPAAVSQR